jgi:tetratricopeptide (TPR) repeat protein
VLAKRRHACAPLSVLAGALDEFWALVTAPLSVDRAAVAEGCRQVVEWALAHEHTQTAIEFAEAAARVAQEDPALANLAARVTRNAGEYARSEVWFNRGIEYARAQGNQVELTRGHLGCGTLFRLLGRVRNARRHLDSGRRAARKHGMPSLAAEAQHDLCLLLTLRGHHAEAEKHARIALRWFPKDHPRFPAFVADVALLLVLRRNFAAAVRLLRGVVRAGDHPPSLQSAILALYSRGLAGAGHTDEAARQRRRVLGLLERDQEWVTLALWHLAEAERLSAHWGPAAAYASRALELATDQGDREMMWLARRTLAAIRAKRPAPPQVIRDEAFGSFLETLAGRLAEWAPRRARPRRAPWGGSLFGCGTKSMVRSETDVERATCERFRAALRQAIARSTLRGVAKDVGMSPTGLQKFLDGTNPYGKTRERLRLWYFREAGFSSFPVEDAAYILRRLVGTLPTPDYGVAGVLDAVDTAYQRAGMRAPEWVRLVRNELGKV